MKQYFFFFLFFFREILSSNYIYPVKTLDIERKITSTFAESRTDHFHNGIDVYSSNEEVLSIEDSKLLYRKYKIDSPFEQNLGSGNLIWLNHNNGKLSSYYHLNSQKIRFKSNDIKKGDTVAFTGNTGYSSASHLHFAIMEQNGYKIVNPLPFLPKIEDSLAPRISKYIGIHSKSSTKYINQGENYHHTSNLENFKLFINISDPGIISSQRRGVYSLSFLWNNIQILKVKFDSLTYKNGKWLTNDGFGYDELYYKTAYLLAKIPLEKKKNQFEIITEDYNQNKTSWKSFFYSN